MLVIDNNKRVAKFLSPDFLNYLNNNNYTITYIEKKYCKIKPVYNKNFKYFALSDPYKFLTNIFYELPWDTEELFSRLAHEVGHLAYRLIETIDVMEFKKVCLEEGYINYYTQLHYYRSPPALFTEEMFCELFRLNLEKKSGPLKILRPKTLKKFEQINAIFCYTN